MYPPSHAKVPPVRPRSSLSTDEHHRIKDTHHGERHQKEPSNALLTLAGFCVFLFVLCSFLLGALVYVGRHIASDNSTSAIRSQSAAEINLTDSEGRFVYAIPSGDIAFNHRMLLSTKPIVRFRPTIQTVNSYSTEVTEDSVEASSNNSATMVTSKIVQQLSTRLPRELRPKHYWLRLRPHFETKTFIGNVTIRLEVLKPISFIPVHAKLLTVSTEHVVHISKDNDKKTDIKPYLTFEHPELEYWVTEFAQPLDVGDYELKLEFRGSLADRIVGFYQSSYLDKERQQQRWIATSKFEPTYARQAFPCFDEPAKKAVFEITLVVPTGDGYHALSNMNIMNENVVGDTTEVNFFPSVPMSTYLSCFIVSDFAHQAKTVRGSVVGASDFEMRVFSTKAQVNKVKYALDTGVGIIEYYIKYFNLRYPLPKLDMAAIPDFVSGAMEHWGLVTYRETALLYDKRISSSENKQRVATVVAHELAHMWFGNLVTMKWWNDLWLNEGFASYIEYKGVNEVHPDWNMLDQFLIHDLHGVMKLDSTLASHPIVQTVEKPSQITELFDSITYSKGASVIRMLEDLVGEVKFRQATTSYLSEFMFENAETDDFLAEVEAKAFGFDVKLIMQTWTEQMGLPVVEVTQNGPSSYKLTQKRFFSNPGDYNATFAESQFNYRWSIPITYYTSDSNEVQRSIFNYNDQEMVVTLPNAVDWIKFNRNQTGYYRVNYPTEMWRALITSLLNGSEIFSISDRAHLISDAFALADASQLDYKVALDLSKYLQNEREYVPWNVGIGHLESIKNLLYYTTIYGDFLQYSRDLLLKAYDDVTWNVDDDNHLKNLLRVNILSAACAFGHEAALEEAADRFTDWLANTNNRPHPDIRSTVYYYGMQVAGNEHNWNKVWQLFVDEGDAQEKIKLMRALAAPKEPWILQRYIILTWNKTYVRDQDYFTVLQYISLNPAGQSLVWDYVRTNWQQLVDRFGINERYLGRLIPGITRRFATSMKLDEMQAFFSKYPDAGAGTAARAEALETVKYNIKWLEENTVKVSDWLSRQKAPLVEVPDENRILKK